MKLAKVLLASSLSLAALAPAASAADITSSNPNQAIQTQVTVDESTLNPDFVRSDLTDEQLTKYRNLTPVTPTYNAPTEEFKIMAAAMSYTIERLTGPSSLTTKASFTTKSTGSVYLTLVQWETGLFPSKPNVLYAIVDSNGNEIQSKRVQEEYTHTNTTLTFNNIPAGTYRIKITNTKENIAMAGNGYVEF